MIEIRNLAKTYHGAEGDFTAVKNINLTINDGDIFGIIGLSGAGKSTLVRCINLLEVPTEGDVLVDGRSMLSLSRRELLAARQNIHMDYGILGSSDLDQASPLAARLQTDFLLPLIYPVVRDGKFKAKFLQKRLDKRARESGDYVKAFLKMFGEARPYVTMQSCKNQFYSDLITPLPDKIHVPGTEIHIFYALKMGAKYRARYQQHFAHPVLHEQNLQHEELLACHPEQWAHLVKSIAL